jgi:two-component system, NarL family, nitrate/nitrite response regulator NarL
MIRVAICSDVRIYREGLAEVLDRRSGIAVVGTTAGGGESLNEVRTFAADVVLLDMSTIGSLGILRQIAAGVPRTSVVALGVSETEPDVLAYAEAGVAGYVTRDQAVDELVDAVVAVGRGEAPCSPRTAALLLNHLSTLADRHNGGTAGNVHLTGREREILALINQGFSNKQIGQRLCIELPTVKNHVHNILEKLGVSGRHEAARVSRELTLL